MAKIRVLDDNLINKIAAGEVIENPASVVKELVENSIDAGSSDICVEIQAGGRQLIRITDDGCGMDQDDALLCLERHATSKIKEIDDIHIISTMGFRGEAIPSIASISKFTLLTCPKPKDGEEKSSMKGTLVIVDGGKILKCCEAARSPGSTIEVKSLFFNVPVRKKFQKSPTYDANEIQKMLSTIALGNPTIKFQLIHNQESVFITAPVIGDSFQEKLGARIGSILGEDFFGALCPISAESSLCKIEGWIGQSFYNRHNRSGQYLFINHRPVVSPLISFAVRDGYGTALASQRHPVFVLHLTLDGNLVDVNVHPQKREVRLRQEQVLRDLVTKAVQDSVQSQGVSSFAFNESPSAPFFPGFTAAESLQSSKFPKFESDPFKMIFEQDETENSNNKTPFVQPIKDTVYNFYTDTSEKSLPWDLPKEDKIREEALTFDLKPLRKTKSIPRVITTLPGYFIIEDNQTIQKGLSIVDQRAAHARILYEKLQNRDQDPLMSQTLLIPYTLDFPSHEAELLRDNLDDLNQLGISIQDFGGNTFAIDAVPTFLNDSDIPSFINGIVHNMGDDNRNLKLERNKQLALAASRAAISTKKQLSLLESQSLVQQLVDCESPYYCPQGKPTIIPLSPDELAKQFEKIGSL